MTRRSQKSKRPTPALIHAFGLFWRVDEVDWNPGGGRGKKYRMLGRHGKNRGKLRVSNFWTQRGIYILYGNYGPHYVGLTRKRNLGKRLRDHLKDQHQGLWDRFCWFGFRAVLEGKEKDGTRKLGRVPEALKISPTTSIGEIEALLIKSMALRNRANMKFPRAQEWIQIRQDEIEKMLERLKQ